MDDLLSTLQQATGAAPPAFDPTKSYGTPAQMLDNLENQESSGGKSLVNQKTGAMGPYQFLPTTVAMLRNQGVKFDPFDPQQSRAAADYYIQQLKQQNGGTYEGALKAYGGFVHADPTQYVDHVTNGVPGFSGGAAPTTPGQSYSGAQPSGYSGPTSDLMDVLNRIGQPQSESGSATSAQAAPPLSLGAMASIAAGAGHGLGSMAMGAQELVGRGLNAVGAHTVGRWLTNDAQQGQQKLDAEVAPYQQAHNVATGAGDIMGGIGGMAALPEVKALEGTGFLANAAKGAVYGATARASNPNIDYLPQKAVDAVAGGLLGGIGAKLSQFVSPYLSNTVNAMRGRLGILGSQSNASSAAAGVVNNVLQQAGVDPSKVSPAAMSGPIAQIADALRTGGTPSPNAAATIARMGEAASLPVPVELSAGQASRDPMQFAQERNWRGVSGVGETVQALEARQNAQLAGNLDALGANQAPAPIDVGRQIIGAASDFDNNWSNHISRLYDAVKNTGGTSAAVNTVEAMQPVAQSLKDSFISPDSLPGDVQKVYSAMQRGALPLTAGDMMSIDKMLSRAQQGASDGNVRYAIGQIRNGLSNATIDGAAGRDAMTAYNYARSSAKQRFDFIDANPWYRDAINGAEPDNFFKRNVLQADTKPLTNMMQGLQKSNPDIAQNVRNATADFLKSKATPRATADEVPVFNHATFDRMVTDPNNVQRLQTVFGPDGFDTIQSINNVARNIKTAPPGANVNTSGTAGALADMAQNGARGMALSGLAAIGRAAGLGPVVDLGAAAARGIGNVVNRQKMVASIVAPKIAQSTPSRATGFQRRLFQAGGLRLSGLAGTPANATPADEQPGQ